MNNSEISQLRPKVDRVVVISEGRELGRGVFTGCNVWMSNVLLDGKSKVSPYPFMNRLLIKESDMDQKPKNKILGPSPKNKKAKPVRMKKGKQK